MLINTLKKIVNKSLKKSFNIVFMKNIKNCQQYLLFYHFFNNMFLKIVLKSMP